MDNQLSLCRIHARIPIQSRTCIRNLRLQLGAGVAVCSSRSVVFWSRESNVDIPVRLQL